MKTIHFKHSIQFPDESEKIIEFTAEFSKSGIGAYEFHGQKCYDSGSWELDGITYNDETLTKEECRHVDALIELGEFDDIAWDNLNDG